jgi:hypothetical protein
VYDKIEWTGYPIGTGMAIRVWPRPGERVPVRGCYSEAMIHYGLAGGQQEVALLPSRLINGSRATDGSMDCCVYVDGKPDVEVRPCEGGFYYDEGFYVYADATRIDPRDLFTP